MYVHVFIFPNSKVFTLKKNWWQSFADCGHIRQITITFFYQ